LSSLTNTSRGEQTEREQHSSARLAPAGWLGGARAARACARFRPAGPAGAETHGGGPSAYGAAAAAHRRWRRPKARARAAWPRAERALIGAWPRVARPSAGAA